MEIILRVVFFVIFMYFGLISGKSYNVLNFGAIGDGKTDDSKAFIEAWKTVCGDIGVTNILLIPSSRTFLLQPLQFQGPCVSSPLVQIDGKIVAPDDISLWNSLETWIAFMNVNNLTVVGSGIIDGFGSSFWKENIAKRPTALFFHNCNNLKIYGITSKDSPKNHISINSCNTVAISNIQLIAPEQSPNTDGIDISGSTNVDISKSTISTGDDCIALKSGSVNINITEIVCGPGHGISIGSLGANGEEAEVANVQVIHCTFNKTTNGARIKTWPGGEGYAKHIYFEHITIIDVRNPIIIDQQYGDKGRISLKSEKEAVAISDVKFIDFYGTTPDENVVTLNCSQTKPCENIVMNGIHITTLDGKKPKINCRYVMGNSNCFKE